MPQDNRVEKLVEALTNCLAELDTIDAQIAAAHVEAALHALRQFSPEMEISTSE